MQAKTKGPSLNNQRLAIYLTVFMPFACGYFLSYLFRNVLSVLEFQLRQDVVLTNANLGFLTAAYFLSFAAFQVPLGIILDRFGPRRVQALLLVVAGLGGFLFALSSGFLGLFIGRLLIGLGFSGGLMASFKALALWFPRERLPKLNGLFMVFGGCGAMAATWPIELGLNFTDWRGIFIVLASLCLLVAGIIFFVVPKGTSQKSQGQEAGQGQGANVGQSQSNWQVYRFILTQKKFWAVVPTALIANGTTMGLLALWAGPYLREVAGLTEIQVASSLFWVAFALTLSFGVSGWLFTWARAQGCSWRQWFFGVSFAYGLCLLLVIIFGKAHAGSMWSLWPWLALAVISNFAVLSFAYLTHSFGVTSTARVNTSLNLTLFFAAFATQYAFGVILDLALGWAWPVTQAYNLALWILLGLQLVSLPLTWWLFLDKTTMSTGPETGE